MRGILSGMVMQRNENNVCEIYIKEKIKSATYTGASAGGLKVEETQKGTRLTGMAVGGPYTVNIDGEIFEDIYVGDLWMLAGQSNMEGCGEITKEDIEAPVDEEIRAYYMQGEWGAAKHPLCDLAKTPYKAHKKLLPEGFVKGTGNVGPGLSFAQEMKKYSGGVPQGVINAAHGGTSTTQWSPDIKNEGIDGSLYAAMVERFELNGSNVRGMFWYQGCSDTLPEDSVKFTERTLKIFEEARKDFGKDIPIVQVQIGPVYFCIEESITDSWSSVKMQQYDLNEKISGIDTITAIDKELSDCIHLTSKSQAQVGKDAAESMAHLLWPEKKDVLAAPRVKKVWVESFDEWRNRIFVELENLHGSLTSKGRPWGFALSSSPDTVNEDSIHRVSLEGNRAVLYTQRTIPELKERYLYYGWGRSPYCNITDEKGRAICAFGPVKLGE